MNKILLLSLVAVFSLVLVGCGSNEEGEANNDGTINIGYAINTLDNPFFVDVKESSEKEAEEQDVNLSVVNANDDLSEQMDGIEDLIQQNMDVIIVDPVDSEGSSAAVNSANEADIPVITTGRKVEEGDVVTHLGYDEVENGKIAGEFLAEELEEKGNVIELQGTPGTDNAKMRSEGFNEGVKNSSDIEVVASQDADFDRTKGMEVTEDILQSNSDIDGLYAANDEMGLGALQAIQSADKIDIKIVSNDGTEDALKAVKNGDLAGTMAVSPKAYGEKAIEIAIEVANDESQDDFIELPSEFISKDNVEEALEDLED